MSKKGLLSSTSEAHDDILNNVSGRIFSKEFIESLNEESNPASKLIGQYLPDPNADWVKEAVKEDPNSWFAQGVGSNPDLNLNDDWVKEALRNDYDSWFAQGVGSNQNLYTMEKLDDLLKDIYSDNSRFAEGYASNPNLNLNDEWVQKELKNLDTYFAKGVGSNPKLNPNDEWVQEKVRNNPNSLFIKHGFRINPHAQLKLILASDLDKIHTALKSKPNHPLKNMLAV